MNDYKYHYLFTTFDIETFDLESFKYNFVNITSFRIIDREYDRVVQILKDMEHIYPDGYNRSVLGKSRIIQVTNTRSIRAVPLIDTHPVH